VEATSTVTLVQKNKGRFQKRIMVDLLSHSCRICGTINTCVFPMIPMTQFFLLNKVKVGLKVLEMLLFMEFRLL
jgi:hypothetical protein